MSKIVITGGAGFLGSHLCTTLYRKTTADIWCLDNFQTGTPKNVEHLLDKPRFNLVKLDISAPDIDIQRDLRLPVKPDIIYNLACPASPPHYQKNPVHTLMTSVMGTKLLLDWATETGATFFQASTSEVYGSPAVSPQPESYWGNVNPIGIRSCYDEGKRAAEALCFDYHRLYGTRLKVVRIFNTYGPRMHPNDGRVVSNFIVQALKNEDITIYGDGSQTRSFCYVDDLIRGFLAMVNSDITGPVNLGNPHEMTMLELAQLIIDLTSSKSKIVFNPLPKDDPPQRRPDISLALKELSWKPEISLTTGLNNTIGYFSEIVR